MTSLRVLTHTICETHLWHYESKQSLKDGFLLESLTGVVDCLHSRVPLPSCRDLSVFDFYNILLRGLVPRDLVLYLVDLKTR